MRSEAQVQRQMPRYKCHKEVHALKIAAIGKCENDDVWIITPSDIGFAPFHVTQHYMDKHDPRAGGYYVVSEDNYKSYSPAKVFEEEHALGGEADPVSLLAKAAHDVMQWDWGENDPEPIADIKRLGHAVDALESCKETVAPLAADRTIKATPKEAIAWGCKKCELIVWTDYPYLNVQKDRHNGTKDSTCSGTLVKLVADTNDG